MKRSLKVFLILISVCILASCAYRTAPLSGITDKELHLFPSDSTGLILATGKITILDQSFNGYFAIKKTDRNQFRIHFSNEIGLTIFDLVISEGELQVYHVLKNIEKPALINKIGSFFEVFLFHSLYETGREAKIAVKQDRFVIKKNRRDLFYFSKSGFLEKKYRKTGFLNAKRIKIQYLGWDQNNPEQIIMDEGGLIRLHMELKIIKLG